MDRFLTYDILDTQYYNAHNNIYALPHQDPPRSGRRNSWRRRVTTTTTWETRGRQPRSTWRTYGSCRPSSSWSSRTPPTCSCHSSSAATNSSSAAWRCSGRSTSSTSSTWSLVSPGPCLVSRRRANFSSDRSVTLLRSMHWLLVRHRIIFKFCSITRSCMQPSYIHSLLTPVRKPVQLQSSSSDLVFVPKVSTNIGTGAFLVAVLTLWNMLPSSDSSVKNITRFRRHLNMHLYNLAYPPYPHHRGLVW